MPFVFALASFLVAPLVRAAPGVALLLRPLPGFSLSRRLSPPLNRCLRDDGQGVRHPPAASRHHDSPVLTAGRELLVEPHYLNDSYLQQAKDVGLPSRAVMTATSGQLVQKHGNTE